MPPFNYNIVTILYQIVYCSEMTQQGKTRQDKGEDCYQLTRQGEQDSVRLRVQIEEWSDIRKLGVFILVHHVFTSINNKVAILVQSPTKMPPAIAPPSTFLFQGLRSKVNLIALRSKYLFATILQLEPAIATAGRSFGVRMGHQYFINLNVNQ